MRHKAARRSALLLVVGLAAAGCLPIAAGMAGPGLAVATTAATGKTPIDHAVSAVSGKDCAIVRSRQGLTYCREDESTPPVTVRCYRTLGDVSCHPRDGTAPGRQRPVDHGAAETPPPG